MPCGPIAGSGVGTFACHTTRSIAPLAIPRPLRGGACMHVSCFQHSLFNSSTRSFSSGAIRPRTGFFSFKQLASASRQRTSKLSTTSRRQLREYFPPPQETVNIKQTAPAWHHPVYTEQQMRDIQVAHRETANWKDWVALSMVRLLRFGADTAMGYSHPTEEAKQHGSWLSRQRLYSWLGPSPMTERKWLIRFLFLESVAGVPGMVAGSVRHLHSLRRLHRDNGWIETLLEEAYNERMHLLTFMKLAEPGWFMKTMIIAAQGVFYNTFFLSYLLAPQICHRFVGYLEEEAVLTYTRAIEDVESGRLPHWNVLPAPEIAIRYWNMPVGSQSMKDLLLYVRADEAKHREVNHTLGSLDQKVDPNPFVSEYKEGSGEHPVKGIELMRPTGWERKDVI